MRVTKTWGLTAVGVLYGAVILIAAYRFGFTGRAVMNLPTMIVLAAAAIVDLQRKMIPDWLTLPGLAWVLGASAFLGWPRLLDALFGVLFCGGIMLLLAVISRGSIGGGDVKLVAMIGASLGWRWGFGVLAFAQLSLALLALCLFIARRKGRKDTLPFGPFLAAFAILAILGKPMQ
jgi:prepilin signal peptidase PulO-like enzyme (type II secretory pathway)